MLPSIVLSSNVLHKHIRTQIPLILCLFYHFVLHPCEILNVKMGLLFDSEVRLIQRTLRILVVMVNFMCQIDLAKE